MTDPGSGNGKNQSSGKEEEKKKTDVEKCETCGKPLKNDSPVISTILGLILLSFLLLFIWLGINTYVTHPSDELTRTLVYITCAGGIGGSISALNAFSKHKALADFNLGYAWWFIFRPIGGLIIGVVVYVLLISNLLLLELPATASTPQTTLAYSVIAFLAGFAFRRVIIKLQEVFATLLPLVSDEKDDP